MRNRTLNSSRNVIDSCFGIETENNVFTIFDVQLNKIVMEVVSLKIN